MRRKVQRRELFELLADARRATADAEQIAEFLEEWEQDPKDPAHSLPLALADFYEGVRNGFLAELYEALTGERVEVVGEITRLLPCPCCRFRTLTELHNPAEGTGYDICRRCGWEDDGTSDRSASSGPNRGSMNEYLSRMGAQPNLYKRDRWFCETE